MCQFCCPRESTALIVLGLWFFFVFELIPLLVFLYQGFYVRANTTISVCIRGFMRTTFSERSSTMIDSRCRHAWQEGKGGGCGKALTKADLARATVLPGRKRPCGFGSWDFAFYYLTWGPSRPDDMSTSPPPPSPLLPRVGSIPWNTGLMAMATF